MPQFSANLGFLWTDLALPDAILAAGRAGFAAVECHSPYAVPPADVKTALKDSGLPLLGLNTTRGNAAAGDMGLSAVEGRTAEARAAIEAAVAYAAEVGALNVHVMAGRAEGPAARDRFLDHLSHAAQLAAPHDIGILIEPLNAHDVPGYFLRDVAQACAILKELNLPQVRLMFDCYHIAKSGGDILSELHSAYPHIGHIQFAGVPDRGNPLAGVVDYHKVFQAIDHLGWTAPLGAEYIPNGPTETTLDWMSRLR